MKRHLIISAGAPTLDSDPKLCCVHVIEEQEVGLRTLHFNGRVRFGVAICNIMEEWEAYELSYTFAAREKFLGKALDPDLLT